MSILAKKLMFVMSQRRRERISLTLMEILGQRTVGPDMGQYDPVTDTGYYGLVPSTELIAGDVLATQIDLTAGVPQYNDGGWLKFYVGPEASCNRNNNGYAYVAYVAKMPNRHSVSWNHINAVNAVYGHRHELLMGMNSQVRLINGAVSDMSIGTFGASCLDNTGLNSEWNTLMHRVSEKNPTCSDATIGMEGGYSTQYHGGPQMIEDNWETFSNSDLGVGAGAGDWGQEQGSHSRPVSRGHYGIASWAMTQLSSIVSPNFRWRPVLQPTSLDPDSDPYDFSV